MHIYRKNTTGLLQLQTTLSLCLISNIMVNHSKTSVLDWQKNLKKKERAKFINTCPTFSLPCCCSRGRFSSNVRKQLLQQTQQLQQGTIQPPSSNLIIHPSLTKRRLPVFIVFPREVVGSYFEWVSNETSAGVPGHWDANHISVSPTRPHARACGKPAVTGSDQRLSSISATITV